MGFDDAAPDDDEDEDNADGDASFDRAARAFVRLRRFEVELRKFIVRAMSSAFGDDWMRRLPPDMSDSWRTKREKAIRAGELENDPIEYADFSDYKAIIERSDNWRAVFKPIFRRSEDVRESFQRLFPIRIATMHARVITLDDELLLRVETARVLKAIRTTAGGG